MKNTDFLVNTTSVPEIWRNVSQLIDLFVNLTWQGHAAGGRDGGGHQRDREVGGDGDGVHGSSPHRPPQDVVLVRSGDRDGEPGQERLHWPGLVVDGGQPGQLEGGEREDLLHVTAELEEVSSHGVAETGPSAGVWGENVGEIKKVKKDNRNGIVQKYLL